MSDKHKPNDLIQNLPIGTRINISNTEYNDGIPFSGTVELSKDPLHKINLVRPDVQLDHPRYQNNKQHFLSDNESFTIINPLPNDLFEV